MYIEEYRTVLEIILQRTIDLETERNNKRLVHNWLVGTYVQVMIVAGTIWGYGLVFAAAEVETATETAAAAIAPGHDAADNEHRLACRRCDHKVRIHILLAKLLRNVQSQGSVVVVDVALRLVAEDGMGAVHLFELQTNWTILKVVSSVTILISVISRIPCPMPPDCPDSCPDGTSGLVCGTSSLYPRPWPSWASPTAHRACLRKSCGVRGREKESVTLNFASGNPATSDKIEQTATGAMQWYVRCCLLINLSVYLRYRRAGAL